MAQQQHDVNSFRGIIIESVMALMRRFASNEDQHVALYTLAAAKAIVGLSMLPVVELECAAGRHLMTQANLPLRTAVGLHVRRMELMMRTGIELTAGFSDTQQRRVVTETLREMVIRVARYRRNPARFAGRARPTDFASSLVRFARRRLFGGEWECPPMAAELSALARSYGGAA